MKATISRTMKPKTTSKKKSAIQLKGLGPEYNTVVAIFHGRTTSENG